MAGQTRRMSKGSPFKGIHLVARTGRLLRRVMPRLGDRD